MTDSAVASADPKAPVPGGEFGGFRIVRLLGRGGMGAVYEAESIEDGRRVAIKVLAGDLAGPDDRRRFLREGQLAAALNHPNTVYIYGTDEVNGMPTITMELVAGGTLDDKVQQQGPLTASETIEIALQMIDGLDAAYAIGILHRDVKPSNCFVGADGSIKVGDFGLSKSVSGGEESKVTRTGMFLGTPAFSAPEQLLGEPLDVRSDIYAIGATLYYLLTARMPFEGASSVNMVAAVMQGSPVSPKHHRSDIPDRLAEIVLKCMQRKATDRYATYEELRADLDSLRAKQVAPAPVISRLGAFAIDLAIMLMVVLPMQVMPVMARILDETSIRSSALDLFMLWVVKGLPESLWGASVGKALLGLRVEQGTGERLGWTRGVLRVAVIWFALSVPDVLTLAVPEDFRSDVSLWIGVALSLLLMASMRRRNGYAALHDLLAGSRVVRSTRRVSHGPTQREPLAMPAVGADSAAERVGPFVIVQRNAIRGRDGSVDLAFDPVLRRSLWIHRRPDGAPALSPVRRDLARAGRLRWVASRRRDDQNWDAYEAPGGMPLMDRGAGQTSLGTTVSWLRDVAAECQVARDAGEPLEPSLDRIWVSGDRAIVLDFALSTDAPPVASTGEMLQRMAKWALVRDGVQWPVLPRAARSLLDELPSATDWSAIMLRSEGLAGLQESVSRRTRGIAMALVIATPVIFAGILVVEKWIEDLQHPEFARVEPFLDLLDDTLPTFADTSRIASISSRGRTETVEAFLQRTARNRGTAAIYVLSRHGRFLSDTNRTSGSRADDIVWPRVDQVLKQHQNFTPADSASAAKTVEQDWKGRVPGQAYSSLPVDGLIAVVAGLVAIAVWSLLLSLVFGVSVTARMAGIDIVTRDGANAGRLRLFLRALLIWLPLFGAAALAWWVAKVGRESGSDLGMMLLVGGGVLVLVGCIVAAVALLNPQRGLPDRMVGTYLVPR